MTLWEPGGPMVPLSRMLWGGTQAPVLRHEPAEGAQTHTITSHLLCFARPSRVNRQTSSSRSSRRT